MHQPRGSINAIATVLASVGLMACQGGDGGEGAPTATATLVATATTSTPTTAVATTTPDAEAEVAQAYLAHWDAYADAVLNLDVSLVEESAVGEELDAIREEIEQLRADGLALRVDVEHDFLVAEVSETSAVLIDQIVNNSFYVDAETKEPPEGEGSGEVLRHIVELELIDGRWVVARVTQEAPT